MAQVSHVDSDISGVDREQEDTSASFPAENVLPDGKKKSLLSKVKDKAKGTVAKIKGKVRHRSGSQGAEGPTDSDDEWEGEESKTASKGDSPLTDTSRESKDGLSGTGGAQDTEAYGGKPDDVLLSTFARSGQSENSPLVAVPTSYSDPHNSVDSSIDAVMPDPVIKPTSVSEVGEESSTNLGEIPEAKEEEKAAVTDVNEGGPDSDLNPGFKNKFNQKDLQAIDGLPKPQGFDINNESQVTSNVSEFGDQIPNVEEGDRGGDRDFPSAGADANLDSETPHPPGSNAEFQDSMFSSEAGSDIHPNEPPAAEAQHASSIGTLSRGLGSTDDTAQSQQHPPASESGLHENMFSSSIAGDLKPSHSDEPSSTYAEAGNQKVPMVGDLSRDPQDNEQSKSLDSGVNGGSEADNAGSRSEYQSTSQGPEESSSGVTSATNTAEIGDTTSSEPPNETFFSKIFGGVFASKEEGEPAKTDEQEKSEVPAFVQ